jgi:hypothetical protein
MYTLKYTCMQNLNKVYRTEIKLWPLSELKLGCYEGPFLEMRNL